MTRSEQIIGTAGNETLLLEGDEARITRLVQESRLKNPVLVETMTDNSLETRHNVNDQQHVSQLVASLARVMCMGMPLVVDPLVNSDGVMSLKKLDGQKQLKRLRMEDSEEVDVESQNAIDVIVMNRVDNNNNNVGETDDVVMNDPAAEAPLNVMAGPRHQARQGK